MWYELKVTIGQKLPKKTEMNKNEQIFLCYFGKNPRMADEGKAILKDLDSLPKW